jgi:hypothetical protein
LIEFIKQYHGNISDQEALMIQASENWHWLDQAPTVTDADVAKGFRLVTVTVDGIIPIDPHDEKAQKVAFAALPKDQQKAITDQADKDFWAKTTTHQARSSAAALTPGRWRRHGCSSATGWYRKRALSTGCPS